MKINTFIIAGAVLAFSAVTSRANDPATFTIGGGNAWTLVSIPWSAGQNTALELESYFEGGENLWTWHGSGYYQRIYYGYGVGVSLGYQSDWVDGGSAPPAPPSIPGDQTDASDSVYWAPTPIFSGGEGFWVQNPNSTYNVSLNGSGPLTITVPINGSAISFVGNATTVPNQNAEGSPLYLTANFAGGETVSVWTGITWYGYQFQGAGVGTGLGYPSDWTDVYGNIPGDVWDPVDLVWWTQPLMLQVGEGLMIQNPNSSTETWTQHITW